MSANPPTDPSFDPTKIAVELAKAYAEKFASAAASGLKALSTDVRARVQRTYAGYIERVVDRYGKGKSFFIRSEPLPLYDFFVPLDLVTPKRTLYAPTAEDVRLVSPHATVTGLGGSGKSMIMRHLLISSIIKGVGVPVFVELRSLNQSDGGIEEAVLKALTTFGLSVDRRFVREALEASQIALLLDGYDEVKRSIREKVADAVLNLALRYPATPIIVSSRQDKALSSWEPFTEYRLAPLDIDKAQQLVEKVPFDQDLKDGFVRAMRDGLFEQHESFLSNPLLLSIMLLTYGDVAEIPTKLSTFYGQAYEALFLRHDALKSGFQRERRSQLDIQDFGKAFSAFSLVSFDAREFSFTTGRALELVAKGRKAAMLEFNDDDFLGDASQAVCLLVEEGLQVSFTHRSFQEYFVAKYILAAPAEMRSALIKRYSSTLQSDAVMALLWEMDRYSVERYLILPMLQTIREQCKVKARVGPSHLLTFLRRLLSELNVHPDADEEDFRLTGTSNDETLHAFCRFMADRYGTLPDVVPDAESAEHNDILIAALREDHGEDEVFPTANLKARGAFLPALFDVGVFWGGRHLQNLMDTQERILSSHAANRESLEEILAGPPLNRKRAQRRLR